MSALALRLGLNRQALTGMAGPVLIMLILGMMVLPLPPFLLDLLFTFNIALAMIVLLTAMYTVKPLDFAIFPTVLLLTTLLRLSLNVASTRVVLMHGHEGPDAAGKVIEAFGHFLVGGNTAVGLVVFIILTVINFVVITKGAGRIAEVGARFTLDAMPGKQMAIDADLNAGLIDEKEAKKRRADTAQEADFYGAMDGASKFVRGDAVAGILILGINVIGGLIVGVLQHNMELGQAATNYTLLTIGDGLVAQLPALIISVAAGLVVSRVGDEGDMGSQVIGQVFSNPQVLVLTATILGILGLIPGMPNFVFLLLAAGLGWLAWRGGARQAEIAEEEAPAAAPVVPAESQEASWADVTPVDVFGLEVGYRLIPMVDKGQDGELLKRIRGLRKKFARDIGFLAAPVHIRDNLELKPNAYRIVLKGVEIGTGSAFPGQFMAINPGRVSGPLAGRETTDPAFGLPAVWIDPGQREMAQALGYTVVDPATVIATHLNHVLASHAPELLGHEEVQELLDRLAKVSPRVVQDLVPKTLPLRVVVRVLQGLLAEHVPIRDMRTIAETLAEQAPRSQDADVLLAAVRARLGRLIIQQINGLGDELPVITLDPKLEQILQKAVQAGGDGPAPVEPGLAERLHQTLGETAGRQELAGQPAVLLVSDAIRTMLARFVRHGIPNLHVLGFGEIPEDRKLKVIATVGK